MKMDRTTIFGKMFSVQHGRTGSVRMSELWLEWKLPEGAFPDWAMQILYTKRRMILESRHGHVAVLLEFVRIKAR